MLRISGVILIGLLLAIALAILIRRYYGVHIKVQVVPSDIHFPLPVFVMPEDDVRNGNGLNAVFVDATPPGVVRFTAVFKDEDYPARLIDLVYDRLRYVILGRIEDVEEFEYLYARGDNFTRGLPDAIYFRYIYSSSHPFKESAHERREIAFDKFKSENGRPILYVNTWNHSFSEQDANPNSAKVYIADYPVYFGTRREALRAVRRQYYKP